MNTSDQLMPRNLFLNAGNGSAPSHDQPSGLRKDVEKSLQQYFSHLGDSPLTNLYELVLSEVEAPLLEAVLRHTGSNQSKASIMLGLNRGTLRKKLKQHGML